MENDKPQEFYIKGSIDDLEPLTFINYPPVETCIKILEKYPMQSSEFKIAEQVMEMHQKKGIVDSKPRTPKEILLNEMMEASKQGDIKLYRELRSKLKKY